MVFGYIFEIIMNMSEIILISIFYPFSSKSLTEIGLTALIKEMAFEEPFKLC